MIAGWRALTDHDLAMVVHIADLVHPELPEEPAVLAERLALYPKGCFASEQGGAVVGYALAHPYRLGGVPALNTPLGALPARPDCLYLHDAALLPRARGAGLGTDLIRRLRAVAQAEGLPWLALTSVHGTAPYWARFGFEPRAPAPGCVGTYGDGAAYMAAPVVPGR